MAKLRKLARIVLIAAVLLGNMASQADESSMNAEIDFLLDTIVTSNCVFVRNGSVHKAEAARDHLQMKRKRGKRYFDSAEEFVEKIAGQSSWTGKDYLIQCGDEPQQTAKSWFTALLLKYRQDRQKIEL